jgi:NitT/TauT family transport system substrate-binding protein
MSHRRTLAPLLILLLLLAGCRSGSQEALRIAINPWPGYDFLYLADQKGFFAEEGVAVELVELTSLGDSRRAFERGYTDGFGGTTVELLLARRHSDRQPRAFYVTNWSEGADQILGGPGIDDLADLRGRRVGVEPASLDLLVLAVALDRAGIAYGEVERVSLAQSEMPRAMRGGSIDAAVTYPPVSLRIREQEGVSRLFSTAEAPRTVLDLLIADARSLDRRPQAWRAVARAFDRAVAYAREHPGEAHRIMARREGIRPEELAGLLEEIRVMDLKGQKGLWGSGDAVAATLARTAGILAAAGHLPGADLDPRTLMRPGIVRGAVPR